MTDIKNSVDGTGPGSKLSSLAETKGPDQSGAGASVVARIQAGFRLIPGPLLGLVIVCAVFAYLSPFS